MTFAKVLKPVVAEADKAVLVGDDQATNLTQFDLLNDLIESFSFVIKRRTDIFYPLIHFDVMFKAVGAKGFFLGSEVFLLRRGGHASIRNHFALLGGDQTTILQKLFTRVVSPIRGAAEGMQDALAIPFLQGID